jgi:hypothetical protein
VYVQDGLARLADQPDNRRAGDVLRVRGKDGNGHAPEQLRRGARTGGSGLRLPPVRTLGGCHPGLSLWPGQRKRVSQQPHRVGARRPYPAGFQVTHGALAQVGPRCELFLREAGSMPERSQERTDRAIRRRGAGQLLHLCYLTGLLGWPAYCRCHPVCQFRAAQGPVRLSS